MKTKYIFVTGGVVSGLGKGITAASLGRLLKARGKKVSISKFDPYINIDPGTMNPIQHGEVFVTEDGGECDLDVGHYERFTDENCLKTSNMTAGKIYDNILKKDRAGEFGGATVQVIPHITNYIKERIYKNGKVNQSEVVITEIGGTVGDIECLPFYEAIRQVAHDVGRENILYVHVTLIPYLSKSGEMKTKPTQHSVKELLSIGIQPDVIVCRTEHEMSKDMREKIALFCNVEENCVIQNIDCDSLYSVPLLLEEENFAKVVCEKLKIECSGTDLTEWENMVVKQLRIEKTVNIALVGKYVELHDAYLSIVEALHHAGIENGVHVSIKWIDAATVESSNVGEQLANVSGILVPGAFGEGDNSGAICAVKYARENKIPFFGICLGMEVAIIEFAQNVLKWSDANSAEMGNVARPVIDIMEERTESFEKGGAARLGAYPCKVYKHDVEGGATTTHAFDTYNEELIYERHRHRHAFNNSYKNEFISGGLIISSVSPQTQTVEIVELAKGAHPFFLAVQFDPQYSSRPNRAHKLFAKFVACATLI